MQCPVCSGEADNRTPNTLSGIVLACPDCGDYRIAGDAYHRLAQLDAHDRAHALDGAKRLAKFGLPMIDMQALRPHALR